MKPIIISLLLGSLLLLAGCDTLDPPKPAPPAGAFVYGGEQNEVGTDIFELPDGNLLLLGGRQDEESLEYHISLTKIAPDGRELWTRVLDNYDGEYGVYITARPGGYLVLGLQTSQTNAPSYQNVVLYWLDEDFNATGRQIIPRPSIDNASLSIEFGSGIFPLPNGEILLPYGTFWGSGYLRLDQDGRQIDYVELGESTSYFPGNFFVKKPNGGYLALGLNDTSTGIELLVNHIDSQGNLLYSYVVPAEIDIPVDIQGVLIAADNSYYISFNEYQGNPQVVHTDSLGNFFESFSFGGTGAFTELFQRNDGSIFLSGNLPSSPGGNNFMYATLAPAATQTDFTIIGGSQSDRYRSALQASNGAIYLIGSTQSFGAGGLDIFLSIFQP